MSFFADIKRPFNLVSTVIALLSILLSVYFYLASVQKREPRYLISTSSQIFSKTVSSPKITVVDSVGKAVSGDIHVVEVSFWNDGKLPIEPADVRTPVIVELPGGSRMLDSKIAKENKPAVSAFTLVELSTSSGAPQVQIGWKHFDPGTGVRLQFIYVGDANPKLTIKGDILDAEIMDGKSVVERFAPKWVIVLVALTLFIASIIYATPLSKRIGAGRSQQIVLLIDFVITLVFSAAVTTGLWFLVSPRVPPV